MNKQELFEKYKNEEDQLLIGRIIDKLNYCKTKNKLTYTDFLDMHQLKICKDVIKQSKENYYVLFGGIEDADRRMLIFYPDKMEDIIKNNYDYSDILKVIKITLPNENIGTYSHRIYLSGLMKLGIKREKFGDILVYDNGAYIIVQNELSEYICNSLKLLTRFNKSKIEILDLKDIIVPEKRIDEIKIIVSSMRLDGIVSELAHTSRTIANKIIDEQRVSVNYEEELRKSREIKENDVIVIRGKGKFKVKEILRETKKGKLFVLIEHNI